MFISLPMQTTQEVQEFELATLIYFKEVSATLNSIYPRASFSAD